MLDNLRRTIGIRISCFRFRASRDAVISFTRSFSGARDVLVVMPFDRSQLLNTVLVIDLLRRTFREENVTFVSGERNQELRRMMPRSQYITVLESEVTIFYLPRLAMVRRLQARSYDLAIDLNLDFLVPSAYICRVSNARVRIGLARKHAEHFFNFHFLAGGSPTDGDVYARLAACLQKF